MDDRAMLALLADECETWGHDEWAKRLRVMSSTVAALEAENAALRARFEALDAIESHGWYFDGRSCVTINCASRADAERVVAAIRAALATPAGGQEP